MYRADGIKVKKLFGDIETDYRDGFQYKSTFQVESWNGQGTFHPDPNEIPVIQLRIIPNAEGYYDALLNQYLYNYSDHLGNIRLSFTDTNKDGIIQPRRYNASNCTGRFCFEDWQPGEIVTADNYYPFGLLHNYTGTTQNAYQYKYNEKELQETGMYDYGARFYMPDLGRWGVSDPMAEDMRRHSPYNYAFGNPVNFVDPDGMKPGRSGVFNATGHWDFDPNSTIMGSDFFGGSQYTEGLFMGKNYAMSFMYDGGGGSAAAFGQTQAYKDIMAAWQSGGTAGLSNIGGILRWWTDLGQEDNGLIGSFNMLKLNSNNSENDWYGPAGKGNWFFGTGATLSGFAGIVQSENMYSQGIRRGLSGNYVLTGRNISQFGRMPMTTATIPISKIGSVGKTLGTGSFFLGVAFDGMGVWNYMQNKNSPNAVHPGKAGLNTVMGYVGWQGGIPGAIISTVYFGVDNFYPGGWVGASETAARTEAYEQQMTGHPFFSNSAIKF